MPPIEILTVDEAAEKEPPAPPPAKEPRSKPRRFYALSFRDHARLLLPFVVAGALGVVDPSGTAMLSVAGGRAVGGAAASV